MPFISNLARLALIGPAEVQGPSVEPWITTDFMDGVLLLDDFVLPPSGRDVGLIGSIWPASNPQGGQAPQGVDVLSPFDIGDLPQILPMGLESKINPEPGPIICQVDESVSVTSEWDALEAALAPFDGRGPHRFLLEPRFLDWIF